mmetsp:Transcript_4431/g.6775  ORF Transcript_4431/g.6775 Transcript_4431/m.6775 type:complete len:555 (-) Transcript_4431:189-1853(-)
MMLRSNPKKREIGGIVVCPTRELAVQVHQVCTVLIEAHRKEDVNMPLPLLAVGTIRSPAADLKAWNEELHSDIVIGTPGRIEDLICRYSEFQLTSFECLILDEADLLLSMGFSESLESILRSLPKWKRVGLFSATMGGDVKQLARAGMRNPVIINVSVGKKKSDDADCEKGKEDSTPSSLTNYYTIVDLDRKLDRLVDFILAHKDEKIVVFFVACVCVEFYGLALQKLTQMRKVNIQTIHGKMNQKRRSLSLDNFLKDANKGGLLLCTDVVSRGIDFDVNWVLQYDPPTDPSCYIHRVGRAGRANKIGSSLLFLTEKEDAYIEFLKLKKVPLQELPENLSGAPLLATEEDAIAKNDSDIVRQIKDATLKSRDLLEKGTRAYTSYIRAYKEHQCGFIFRMKSLDLGKLATSFCLLKLPKMPELANVHTKLDFKPEQNVEFYKIPYEDKVREQARQKRMKDEAKQEKLQKQREEKKQRREEKKAKRDERLNPKQKKKRVGRHQRILEEWDDLAKEERLHKKLKRGKITQEEYDRQMFGDTVKKGEGDVDIDDMDSV